MDGVLSNLIYWNPPCMAGELELDDLQGPFQPKPFCDSMNALNLQLFALVGPSDRS